MLRLAVVFGGYGFYKGYRRYRSNWGFKVGEGYVGKDPLTGKEVRGDSELRGCFNSWLRNSYGSCDGKVGKMFSVTRGVLKLNIEFSPREYLGLSMLGVINPIVMVSIGITDEMLLAYMGCLRAY